MKKFYELRGYSFAWSADRRAPPPTRGWRLIDQAEAHGLEPAWYGYEELESARHQIAERKPKGDAGRREIAQFDVRLTTSLMIVGPGRRDRTYRPRRWRAQRKLPDLAQSLSNARNGDPSWLDAFRPPHEAYVGLQKALAALRGVRKGGWPRVSRDVQKRRVETLVRRLEMSGRSRTPSRLDRPTAIRDAVESFQSHHGLAAERPPRSRHTWRR